MKLTTLKDISPNIEIDNAKFGSNGLKGKFSSGTEGTLASKFNYDFE